MGTRWTAQFYAPVGYDTRAIAAELGSAVACVDAQMSNWRADSDLSRLNRATPGKWVAVPANLAIVLARALEIGRDTDNAFNIGVGELVGAWGFGPEDHRAASTPASRCPCPPLGEVLDVDVPNRRARRNADIGLDLCGIAKGFGVDELARVLRREGMVSWLVGIDGEMRAHGSKPDGAAWAIAIELPDYHSRAAMGVIELSDAAVATSGDYRHWMDIGDRRVSHTMDPREGAPVCNGVASVTVVTSECTRADAFATALMVLGIDAGRACAEQHRLDVLFAIREAGALRTSGTGCFAGLHA
jgi:thiamine biosynthesis lipoprotein